VPKLITDVNCGDVIQNAWPITSALYINHRNLNCNKNPWLCSLLDGHPWNSATTGLIAKGNGNCVAQCEATSGCTAVMMDTSGATCYFMSDMSMWPLHYELYNGQERYSVARVCTTTTTTTTPFVPKLITDVTCGDVVQDAWPITSALYINHRNLNCDENPWLCSLLDGRPWNSATTGLIAKGNNNCVAQCEATAGCTAVMMDTSGATCYFMSDMSMWPLHYELYNGQQRYSVARVC